MSNFIGKYATFIFDCDGVILNSNHIKTEAFRTSAAPWGKAAAEDLVTYHIANGGISRHRKFGFFLESILPNHVPSAVPGFDGPDLDELLFNYAQAVHGGLMTCCIAEGLQELRLQTSKSKWCVVSGGDQTELRKIFSARQLDHLFDGGIYGSPDDKDIILAREIARGSISPPALFLGDSCYDYMASCRASLDFLFVSGWTDLQNWEDFVLDHQLPSICRLAELLSSDRKLPLRK